MNTLFLCSTQYTNVGDLLINKMLIEELSKYGKVFVDIYNKPKKFQQALIGNSPNIINLYNYNNLTMRKFNPFKFYNYIKHNDIKLLTTNAGPLGVNSKFDYRTFFINLIFFYIRLLGVQIYLIGRCCSSAIKQNLKVHKGSTKKIFVRSLSSVDYLKKNHIIDAEYIPDLAFLYSYKIDIHTICKKRIVAFSFRESSNEDNRFYTWIETIINYYKSHGYQIILFYQVSGDKVFMQSLNNYLRDDEVLFVENQLDYYSLSFYKDIDIVVSNRLHCLLIGACYGCIPLAELDDNFLTSKIKDVFRSSFSEEYKNFIDCNNGLDKVKNLVDNYDFYYSYIKEMVKKNAEICQETIKKIAIEITSNTSI